MSKRGTTGMDMAFLQRKGCEKRLRSQLIQAFSLNGEGIRGWALRLGFRPYHTAHLTLN